MKTHTSNSQGIANCQTIANPRRCRLLGREGRLKLLGRAITQRRVPPLAIMNERQKMSAVGRRRLGAAQPIGRRPLRPCFLNAQIPAMACYEAKSRPSCFMRRYDVNGRRSMLGAAPTVMMTRRSVLHCLAGSWTACRWRGSAAEIGRQVQTVTGPAPDLGPTLMHEHIVTDLRPPSDRRPGDYDPDKAYEAVLPYLRELHQAGCRCLVEPTPIHIGRDPNVLRRLSKTSNIRIVAATGIYGAAKQKFIPQYAREQNAQQLAEGYIREYNEGIQSTGIRPGIIKTGVNQDVPLPEIEQKLVLAAVLAHKATGLTVASHTGSGAAALAQLGILESARASPSRFIWVHAQSEKDHSLHRQLAREGMWVEFDGIRPSTLDWHLECVQVMADAGLLGRVLISQDAGWYRPGEPGGGNFRGYKYLFADFLPALERASFSKADVEQLIEINPMRALSGSN